MMRSLNKRAAGLMFLVCLSTVVSAFEMGSCFIIYISDTASTKSESVGIAVSKKVFEQSTSKTTASASDFLVKEPEAPFTSDQSAPSPSLSDTAQGNDFSFEEQGSAFDSSPFGTSGFGLE